MAVLKERLNCGVLMPHPSESWDYGMPLTPAKSFQLLLLFWAGFHCVAQID